MAIDLQEQPDSDLITVDLSGKLTRADYQHLVPTIDEVIHRHGTVRMLVRMRDFHGWQVGAAWDDFRFSLRHYSHVTRLALLGDQKWERWMATVCRPFTRAEVRYFRLDDEPAARAWLTAA